MRPWSLVARTLALGCSGLALLPGSSLAASFTYTTLPNFSDADYCFPTAINDNDVVVGGDFDQTTAFFWQNGASTFVNTVPEFYDITSSGLATAKDPEASMASYSLYDISTGSLQSIKAKSVHYRVYPYFINSSGLIGAFLEARKGFDSALIQGSKATLLVGQGNTRTWITGLNDSGEAVGYYYGASGTAGFSYLNGNYTYFTVSGSNGTTPGFVAADGTITGYYTTPGQNDAFGFEMAGGTTTTFRVPGATNTYPQAIGPKGEIVGRYQDARMVDHGFIYVEGKFYTVDYPGSVSSGIVGVNSKGTIVGGYTDAQGMGHTYIGQCSGGKTCTK